MIDILLLLVVVLLPILYIISSKCRYLIVMTCFYACILLTSCLSLLAVIWRPYEPNNHL